MFRVAGREIGRGSRCYVIAEAGSNHNGSLEQARSLIEVAAEAGADAVKFQTFRADTMYPTTSTPVEYLRKLGVSTSIYEIIKSMEMPTEWIEELAAASRSLGLHFMSTPFDEASVDALDPFVDAFKIASYELTHLPLVEYVASRGKPVILSTGAGTLEEIADALEIVRGTGNDQICILQCTAKYPAPLDAINVAVIPTLRESFGVTVGLSDHSAHPIIAPTAATAVGANVIEKHFTHSRRLPGPDHRFALEPDELSLMVESIRRTEKVLGSNEKAVQEAEFELSNYRRSIYSRRALPEGYELSIDDLIILRRPGVPPTGLEPKHLHAIVGRTLTRDVPEQEILRPEDVTPRLDG